MIVIVDDGVGNIHAFLSAFRTLNVEARVATCAAELKGATKIVMPGMGAFDHAMERLEQSGMRDTLDDLALRRRVPVLGVCIGMQMFAMSSEEGERPGLGWIRGRVRGLHGLDTIGDLPQPHMGWNDVRPARGVKLFEGLENDAQFYFLHSFFFQCENRDDVAAVTDYGAEFACAVQSSNIMGVQFHPEKSHQFGTRLLRNFAEM